MATAITNDSLVGKLFNFMSTRGYMTLSDLLRAPSPLSARIPTEDAANIWVKENLSTDKRFAAEEDHAGKIMRVKVASKVRMCLNYVESGTCLIKDGCKFWHVCKGYIEGNCDKICRYGKSHDFHDEQNGGKTEQLGFGKFENGTVRRVVAFNCPQVCSAYVKGPCVDINCPYLHLCAGFVNRTCFDSFKCNQSHNLRSDHNKSVLKKHGLSSSIKEVYILCNVLLPKKELAPNNAGNRIKTTAEENISKSTQNAAGEKCVQSCGTNRPSLSAEKPVFKSQTGSQRQAYQSTPHSLNLNVPTFPDEESRQKKMAQSVGNVNRSREGMPGTQGGKPAHPHAQKSAQSEPTATFNRSMATAPPLCGFTSRLTHAQQQANLSQPPKMNGVVNNGALEPRSWVGKGRGMRNASDQGRPGNSAGDCSGFTPPVEWPLPMQRCEYPDEGAANNANWESTTGWTEKKKRTRSRTRKHAKTKIEQEKGTGEATETQVSRPNNDAVCGQNYNFPKQSEPFQELPPKQEMSAPPGPQHSQGAVGQSKSAKTGPGQEFGQEPVKRTRKVSFANENEETASKGKDRKQMTSSEREGPSSSVGSKPELVEISEKLVFECICKEYNCSVKFSDISGRADLFPNGKADAEAWFRKGARKNSFIITEGENKELLEIIAFSSKLRLCFGGSNCSKDECGYFHVCRDFIGGCCKSGATCRNEHEFRNEKDKQLVSSLKILNGFTEEQLGCIFRASTPHVCLDYNAGKCQKGEKCNKIHVCKDFVRKRCRRGACSLDHDNAYETPNTRELAEKFRMSVLTMKRVIIVPSQPPQGQLTDPGHVHQNGSAHICSDFILGQCKNGTRCAKHHCPLPYQWQYRDTGFEQTWISCDEKDNESLEESYCDYNNGDNLQMKLNKTPFHTDGTIKMVLDFENMTMLWPPVSHFPVKLRRLSTESSVMNSNNPLATTWTWYWQDEYNVWEKYSGDQGDETDVQCRIERAFLDPTKSCYDYRTSEHSYALYFRDKVKGMHQRNQHYNTMRKIRRRPEIRSTDEIEQLKRKGDQQTMKPSRASLSDGQQPGLPSHWTRMSHGKDFERVTVSPGSPEFSKVKRRFHITMSEEEKLITKIERVQNPFLWEKYARKKDNMKTKVLGSSLEKDLFHGTNPDDVAKICKQNFDWRLCGTNGTVYGQGSYFALNASYSDSYARQAGGSSSCFMFLANVLVGSYVKGDSNIRRPPPKKRFDPTSDLYDSCVDDKDNPEIFVVFEMDQCYPAYVIVYEDVLQDYGVALSPRAYAGGTSSANSLTSQAALARQARATVQTRSSVGTSSRPSASSSGYQSITSYSRPAVSARSSSSTVQTSPSLSSYQSPTSYSASSRAASSSPSSGTSSVSSRRTAPSPPSYDPFSASSTSSSAYRSSTSRGQASSYGRSSSTTQPNSTRSSKEECVVL